MVAAAGSRECACPALGAEGEALQLWMQCIGLSTADRERLVQQGWAARDFADMTMEDAMGALELSRVFAWRITRCGHQRGAAQSRGDTTAAAAQGAGGEEGAGRAEAATGAAPADALVPDDAKEGRADWRHPAEGALQKEDAETRHDCQINLYGGLYFSNFYFTLVKDMPQYCGCTFKMRKYPVDTGEDILPHSVCIVGNEMDEMELLDAAVNPVLSILRGMQQRQSAALSTIGFMYFGDELMKFPMHHDLHQQLAWVYHQMWRPDLRKGVSQHYQDADYLLDFSPERYPARVAPGMYWFPLGVYNSFETTALLDKPIGARQHLFGFLGSVNGKPRGAMVDSLLNHPRWDALRARGHLRVLGRWHDSCEEPPSIYRAMLYDTQYVPCPTGIHFESFRTWEALEVGAIPIVVDGPEHELLIRLDLGIVVLSAWAELPLFLLNVTREETEARGSKVRARWGAVKSGLRRHMLRAVCQLRP